MKYPLYPKIYEWQNLLNAHRQAAKGKRGKIPAAQFEFRLEDNLIELQNELKEQTYRPGGYVSFYIHEPKRRLISAAPFRDRVVHHALCNIIEPIFEKSFIHDSYANRIGKGTHRALDRAQAFCRKYRYVLPCDIKQYFPSIDHEILTEILGKKVADAETMGLISLILESGVGILKEAYDMVYFPGDDLFAVNRPRGLPIGNLTSQFWANCYLSGFDHFVKRELRCKGYVRYVDDMLLFGNDKEPLWEWKRAMMKKLAELRLTIHEKRAQVQPVNTGVPFLGFNVFPNKRRLKRRKGVAYRRKLRKLALEFKKGAIPLEELKASAMGWRNHVRYGDTDGLQRSVFGNIFVKTQKGDHVSINALIHQNF